MPADIACVPVTGTWWRQVPAGAAPLPDLRRDGDGRWQRGSVIGGLYLAGDAQTAWAEWYRIRAAVTPVRVVCNNTLTWALKGARRVYAVRHRGALSGRLHEARRVLEITVDYYRHLKLLGDQLASQTMSERQLRTVLDELYPRPDGPAGGRAVRNALRSRTQIMWLFREGATVGNAPGSKWAAVNAICEHLDYQRPVRGERFARIVGEQGNPKNRALELVAAA